MIKEFLQSLEDPKRPLLAPNYWFLRRLGLILPKNKIFKIALIILYELVTSFVVTQYIEIYCISSDLDLVLTNLRLSMLSLVGVVKANTVIFWQKSWKEVMGYVTDADKYERDTRNSVTGKIIDRYTKYCRILTYSYWALALTTSAIVSTTPLVKYLSSSTYREELRNGTEPFPHIFSSWMPMDKNVSPGCWITVLWHLFCCMFGGSMIGAYDTTVIVIMAFFGGKLEMLRERSKRMLGSDGCGVTNEEAWKVIRQLHDMHLHLTKYLRLFNSLLSPVMFLYVVMCALMLCASAFQLTSASTTTQKLLMAEYLIYGVAQLFMFCWCSNYVFIKSQDVVYGPYESEWWAANVSQKKGILLLAGQFRISHIFTAGPFVNMSLATFIAILKGAYSYYTLLQT